MNETEKFTCECGAAARQISHPDIFPLCMWEIKCIDPQCGMSVRGFWLSKVKEAWLVLNGQKGESDV